MADEKLIFDILTGQNTLSKTLGDVQKQTSSVEKSIGSLSKGFAGVSQSISGLAGSFKLLAGSAVAAVGAFVGSEIVRAAEESETAINRLNAALKLNGNFTQEASDELIAYSESLQKTSTIADDVTLANLALLQSLAPLTKEGLIAANTAAADLSAALRIDLESAVRLVGKAANGEVEAFKRYGVEIRKGASDSETFANAIDLINKRFGGAATNEINTFAGAVTQSKNAFGDVLEEIGNIIIKTPEVISLVKSSGSTFASLAESIKDIAPAARESIGTAIKEIQAFIVAAQNAFDSVSKSRFGRALSQAFADVGQATSTVFSATANAASIAAEKIGLVTTRTKSLDGGLGDLVSSTDKTYNSIISGSELASESTQKLNKQLLKTGAIIDDQARKALEGQVKNLENALKSAGQSQFEIIAKEAGERTALIVKAERAGVLTRKDGEDLIEKVRLDSVSKASKAEEEALDKRRKKLQESIQIAAQNPLNLAFKDVNLDISDQFGSAFAGIAGGLQAITKGAQGAASLLSGAAAGFANALVPGVGAAVGPIIDALAQGPAAVKSFVDGFVGSVPTIIENIILAIPQLIQSLAENLGPLIERLLVVIPQAIENFVARLPEVAVALTEAMVRAAVQFGFQMPFVATRLAVSLTAEMPRVATQFVTSLVSEAPRFITELIKSIPSTIGGGLGGIAGGAGGIFGAVGGVFGGIGDVFGFADGGIVPGGAPLVDRVPALLTPGEAVIDRSLVDRLDRFLSAPQSTQQGGPIVVNLVVGEQQLANAILDLNRRGFRLS